jgi:hypothetical protein
MSPVSFRRLRGLATTACATTIVVVVYRLRELAGAEWYLGAAVAVVAGQAFLRLFTADIRDVENH